MPENYCAPYPQCEPIDGQLLIHQTLQGPSLATPGDIGLGDLQGTGVLRPFCHFIYSVRWVPKEVCQGPVRSVLGLAPGETMNLETRQVEQFDFTQLMQEATESSEVVTRSGPASLMRVNDKPFSFELAPRYADKFGSILEVIGAVTSAVLGGPIGAGVGAWVGGAVDGWLGGDGDGGGGSGNGDVQDAADEVLESVTHSQSHRTLTETTTSQSSLFERTVTRTFTNPYRDRSLQLRFIPVFRHFEVITTLFQFHHGLSLQVLSPQFRKVALSARLGDFIQKRVTDPRIVSVASAELGLQDAIPTRAAARPASALTEHLNANSEYYAKQYLQHLDERRDTDTLHPAVLNAVAAATKGKVSVPDAQNAFVWSRAQVRGKSICVPMAGALAAKALKMDKMSARYTDALKRIEAFRLEPLIRKRDVHLFMGTHIEPSAGQCILKDLPPAA